MAQCKSNGMIALRPGTYCFHSRAWVAIPPSSSLAAKIFRICAPLATAKTNKRQTYDTKALSALLCTS